MWAWLWCLPIPPYACWGCTCLSGSTCVYVSCSTCWSYMLTRICTPGLMHLFLKMSTHLLMSRRGDQSMCAAHFSCAYKLAEAQQKITCDIRYLGQHSCQNYARYMQWPEFKFMTSCLQGQRIVVQESIPSCPLSCNNFTMKKILGCKLN